MKAKYSYTNMVRKSLTRLWKLDEENKFADETPINPFDFWQGANFKLKIRKVEGYQNYDKSEFDNGSALFDDDDKLRRSTIHCMIYLSLQHLISSSLMMT